MSRECDMHTLIRVALTAVLVTSALGSQSAHAAEVREYSTVGTWTIAVDRTMGDGCFVYSEFVGGNYFRLGFDMTDDPGGVYTLFGNAKWRSIEYGKDYPIEMRFGDETEWTGTATGFSFEPPENQSWLRLYIAEDGAVDFVEEFMRELFVTVHYNGKQIMRLNLRDSYRAGSQLVDCQQSTNRAHDDPFEETSSPRDDPFQ